MKLIKTNDGKMIQRVSCWIKIRQAYDITSRHSLHYYRMDENGYRDGQSAFNPSNGTYLDYFRFNGRKYAIEQFLRLDHPIMFEENDKLQYLSGYDSENYYNPLLIEIDDSGEYVRCYYESLNRGF